MARNTTFHSREDDGVLDHMIDELHIVDTDTELPPIDDEERAIVKIQLRCAQILMRDMKIAKHKNIELTTNEILNELLQNLSDNIMEFTNEILANDNLKINIDGILKHFNKKF